MLRVLVPLAALAAMAAFAGREADPASAAESAYLGVLAAAALLPIAFLAPWPAVELGLGSVLATAAVWALPPGPGRGAAVMLLLVSALAVAAGRRLSVSIHEPSVTVPLALALQVLLRGDLLFEPALDPRTLVALVVLPVAAGLSVSLLTRRHGTILPLIAGGTAALLAPGFNVASTLALVALAAGDLLAWEGVRWPFKAAAVAALLAPLAWDPKPGLVAAVCGLALARPGIALGLAVPVAAGLGWSSRMPWDGMVRQLASLPILVPGVAAPERDRLREALTAVLLVATVPVTPNAGVLAAPLALAALSLRRNGAFTVPQRVWTGALVGGTALLASYPWLRKEPVGVALSLLGLPPGLLLAGSVVCVFLVLAGLGIWMGRGWGEPLRSLRLAGLSAAVLVFALLSGLPGSGTPLLTPEVPVVLDAKRPVWETAIPEQAMRTLVVESSLSNGAALAPGTPVAVVRLRDLAGRTVDWTLRAGQGTGEWAAGRPDVARTGTQAPSPWISWVAGDFFAQRYRDRWTLARPDRFVRLRVERAPGVPPDLAVALYQLEIRR
ncbi:MAG TPA: hypothetical protein VG477_00265 [Thermoanaerobaculia bacterium]|nr:hypothetical protein [Thermoanaerobaculia bacterium]